MAKLKNNFFFLFYIFLIIKYYTTIYLFYDLIYKYQNKNLK